MSSVTTRWSCWATATRAWPAPSPTTTRPASPRRPSSEAVERLVAVVRRARPQVMVVYGDEQSGYPHPDHLRVHDIGVAAYRAAGDPHRYPAAGAPWQPGQALLHRVLGGPLPEVHDEVRGAGPRVPVRRPVAEAVGGHSRPLGHHVGRRLGLRRRPQPGAAGPRHPGRPQVPVLVRPPARGDADASTPTTTTGWPWWPGRTARWPRREPRTRAAPRGRWSRICSPACGSPSDAGEAPGEQVAVGRVVRPGAVAGGRSCPSARATRPDPAGDHRGPGRGRPLLLGAGGRPPARRRRSVARRARRHADPVVE